MTAPRANSHLQNRFLAALSAADFALLSPHLQSLSLKQGDLLYDPGDRIDYVYFPHDGMISLMGLLRDGQAIELATVGREGVVGTQLILGSGISPSRANIQVAGRLSRIEIGHFVSAFEKSTKLRNQVIRYNEIVLGQIQTTGACNSLHTVESRLARWILQTSDRIERDEVPLTQEFLAQMLAVQRTSVTLIARTLQAAGLIRYSRGRIIILDRAGLAEVSCECYATIRDSFHHHPPTRD